MIYTKTHLINVNKFLKFYGIIYRTFLTTASKNGSCHLDHSPNAKLSKSLLDRYMCLPIPECKVMVSYVWIDGTGENVRSRTRTLDYAPKTYKECPTWNYNGNSTYQSAGEDSDLYLCPCAIYNDPTRRGNSKILLCEVYTPDHKPAKTNHRVQCLEKVNCVCDSEPTFGFQQEFQFMDVDKRNYGWPIMLGEPKTSSAYYCGVGANKVYCRSVMEAHYRACLYAGIYIFSVNPTAVPSQWKFQVGPSLGIKAADDLWIARFLLARIAEEYGLCISYKPKLSSSWKGAGCNTLFSTKAMREDDGIKHIEQAICLLEKKHMEHLKVYDPKKGVDNLLRLDGKFEASSVDKFTSGVGKRNVSVRIPRCVADKKKGYLEDRRPAANADPYAVIQRLIKTILLNKTTDKNVKKK